MDLPWTWTQVLVLAVLQTVWAGHRNLLPDDHVVATVNATASDSKGNIVHISSSEDALFGLHSPKTETRGLLLAPTPHNGVVDLQGCDPQTRFSPPRSVQWVALMQRGNCTFREKIQRAASFKASAVLIYNNSSNETVRMGHEGTGAVVAVMIPELFGRELLSLLERNLSVHVRVLVGPRSQNSSRSSLLFVSVSFIVLLGVSSAWLLFYCAQRLRGSTRGRTQRGFGDAAKKAIRKLTTRTVRRGDKETDPDFNHCAVCIESYQLNDVVRILPCKHVFHKGCVDPWLNEHCTCPMCKLNILKALGIVTSIPCVDSVSLDGSRYSPASRSQRTPLSDSLQPSIILEPSPAHPEATPTDITITVTSGVQLFSPVAPPRGVAEVEIPESDFYEDKS
ncbi:E3 ubiquitin-protein ligase RNF130 [Periophthalmus magnuspinnatus]|uniref:E3 ubiquitin-protein ligase RNF130 n=1 Tax=Periophthalmus magnuspinnatus TaxID=409849 RepID=UPI00145A4E47|nr:E3 ubiquitin-protein ligase RNF130 [Periophthalmus magnuspinnatus]